MILVFTEPFFIDVNTVAVDTTKAFKPIKALRSVGWNILDYWPYLLGALLLSAAIVLYFVFGTRNANLLWLRLPSLPNHHTNWLWNNWNS